jgi:ATP-dependent Clp protease adaptor protein ClpS
MNLSHADQPEIPGRPHETAKPARPTRGWLPYYKIVLHYDAQTDLMFVVRCVMELTRFARAEATHKMWEAHHGGRSVLFTTYRERAELFVELFTDKGLRVSIEPV